MVMGQTVGSTDVIVLGAGPGGYVAAVRAAQLGKRVILVEDNSRLGGVCLRCGCIPSKALIHASEFLHHLDHSDNMGITVDHVHFDPKKMQSWKEGIIDKLSDGVYGLCKKHGIEVIHAKAYFQDSRTVGLESLDPEVHLEYGAIEFKRCIIATGSIPRYPPGMESDGNQIIGSMEALSLQEIPRELLVVGGGYIGVELGMVYAKFGSKVTILERGERLLAAVDADVARVLVDECETLGINIMYHTSVVGIDKQPDHIICHVDTADGKQDLTADKAFIAIGRMPFVDPLQLNKTKVQVDERGFIKVNEQRQTDDPHIYAIGDVVGGAMLAHKASMEGRVAAEVACGLPSAWDAQVVPAVVFSDPEIAMVGPTEQQAKDQGLDVVVGKFPFKASGRALTMNDTRGFVKVIADKTTHVIVGVHIVGPDASDLISEAALAIEMGAKIEDVSLTIHPHPTLSEALSEATQSILGHQGKLFSGSK